MATLNNFILIGIVIACIINVIIELDETRSTKYVIITKCLFITMAVGAILTVVKTNQIGSTIFNASVLISLIIRIIRGLNRLKNKFN